MSNLNNTDVFGNLNVINNNTVNDMLTVNGELYGNNSYIFSGYDEAYKHWDWYNMGTSPTQLTQNEDSWYITYSAGDWAGGLLSKKRFRREDGLTLEFEIYCNRSAQNYDIMFGFVDGNSTSYSYGQVPANLIYFSWPPNTYIFENGSNVFSENTINTPDTWKRFRIIMNNTGTSYQVLNGVVWTTIFSSLTNNSKYLRILLCCYQGNIRFRNMRVFQQSTFLNGDRGVFMTGQSSTSAPFDSAAIDYITISTPGNATTFGNATVARRAARSGSNGLNGRGVCCGGINAAVVNTLDYVTISTIGNASAFGTCTAGYGYGVCSNLTGNKLIMGGRYNSGYYATIEYITVSTTMSTYAFGSLTVNRYGNGSTSNGTNNRGLFAGGEYASSTQYNTIDYVTINTSGNATSLGTLSGNRSVMGVCSNTTSNRAVFMGGQITTTPLQLIEYLSIVVGGACTSFGNISYTGYWEEATSNGINNRGVYGGMYAAGVIYNYIEYVTITTPGNATDFGDLTANRMIASACSNCN